MPKINDNSKDSSGATSNQNQNDNDCNEIEFVEEQQSVMNEGNDDDRIENVNRRTVKISVTIPVASNLPVHPQDKSDDEIHDEDFVQSWISDVVSSTLNELEDEDDHVFDEEYISNREKEIPSKIAVKGESKRGCSSLKDNKNQKALKDRSSSSRKIAVTIPVAKDHAGDETSDNGSLQNWVSDVVNSSLNDFEDEKLSASNSDCSSGHSSDKTVSYEDDVALKDSEGKYLSVPPSKVNKAKSKKKERAINYLQTVPAAELSLQSDNRNNYDFSDKQSVQNWVSDVVKCSLTEFQDEDLSISNSDHSTNQSSENVALNDNEATRTSSKHSGVTGGEAKDDSGRPKKLPVTTPKLSVHTEYYASERIPPCQIMHRWISDVVTSSLNDLEGEDESVPSSFCSSQQSINTLSDQHSDADAEFEGSCLSVMSKINSRIYSESSFRKGAAKFLDECSDISSAHHDSEDNTHKGDSTYNQYARKADESDKTSTNTTAQVTKRKEGCPIDFIARNISMVSQYGNRSKLQKSKRRPMTAVAKVRPKVGSDKDPTAPGIRYSLETLRFQRGISPYAANPKILKTTKKRKKRRSTLNENQLASFKKLFDRFDTNQSGGISAEELFSSIQELVPEEQISFEDVQKVHAELDLNRTGEIDFDEFLYAVVNPKNYLKLILDEDRKQLTKEIKLWEEFQKRQMNRSRSKRSSGKRGQHQDKRESKNKSNIFFTMLRTAAEKDSMTEIRHFYLNKIKKMNDHVIQDWSAGQRCVGLSDEDILKRYDHIMKKLKDKKSPFSSEKLFQDSPYAQPLKWKNVELKLNSETRKSSGKSAKVLKILKQGVDKKTGVDSTVPKKERKVKSSANRKQTRPATASPASPATESPKVNSKRVVDSPNFKRSLSKQTLKVNTLEDVYRAYSAPPSKITSRAMGKKESKLYRELCDSEGVPKRRMKISEMVVTPKAVALPAYKTEKSVGNFDYNHVEDIRHRSASILHEYYNKLKKVSATNSKVIYKKLQVEQIKPGLRKQFRKSYKAYSGDCKPFVVSPWIPCPSPRPPPWRVPLGGSYVKQACT